MPPRPQKIASAFFNKSLQQWVNHYFDANLGFRKALIRTFNEINFRIFREAPRLRLYTTPANGLYSQMSLDSLNDEVSRRELLQKRYQQEARKLLRVQQLLESQGKDFQVLIATSKPYVYPNDLGTRYLIGGGNDIFERAASFGKALRAAGVNVIDGGPLLREFAARTGIETHPRSGVHWNYYAGCLIARQMLEDVHTRGIVSAPLLDCGAPTPGKPRMVDVDGLKLLNIWSTGGIEQPTPYPNPTVTKAQGTDSHLPKFVFVSDSFSDQVRYTLQQAHVYSRLVNSGYFRVREIDDPLDETETAPDVQADEAIVREQVAADIAESNVVVLEMVDYNVQRWDYGFADYLLNYAARGGSVEIASTSGAYARETDGPNWWNWVQHEVVFKLQPAFVPAQIKRATLRFEYSARERQDLVVRVQARGGSSQQFAIQSQGGASEKFESIVDLPPTQLDEITIQTDGRGSALGAGDPRIAALMIRNLTIEPLSTAIAQ
ncbi:hypothetical protein CA602_00965 [Paraburkholderia hospita]|nr:hypothetical protein CA602_00965 [Paraburkholderia hospita]